MRLYGRKTPEELEAEQFNKVIKALEASETDADAGRAMEEAGLKKYAIVAVLATATQCQQEVKAAAMGAATEQASADSAATEQTSAAPTSPQSSMTETAAETVTVSAPLSALPEGLDPAYSYESRPTSPIGIWDGLAKQDNVPPYKIMMTVINPGDGSFYGVATYPEFNCMSEFESAGFGGNGAIMFKEISSKGPCMDGGRVTFIMPSGGGQRSHANWEWRTPDNKFVSIAKLYKRIDASVAAVNASTPAAASPAPATAKAAQPAPAKEVAASGTGRHGDFTAHMNGLDFIRFDSGSVPSMKFPTGSDLMRAATWLAKNPDAKLRIEGRVDKTETRNPQSAKDLSNMRLDLVENFLWARGVPEQNIERVNLGLDNPYGLDRSTESRVKNRSVRIVILN